MTFPSPYAFVPASANVVEFDAAPYQQAHDVPQPGAWSGTFDLEVEAVTPLFVGGSAKEGTRQFVASNGKPVIPGSSLRGMLRNVVEIASFARLQRVGKRAFGVRDLHNRELYIGHMAALKKVDGKSQPVPLVCAGWLQKKSRDEASDDPEDEDVVATIEPTSYYKLDYGLLLRSGVAPRNYEPGRKQSAKQKYQSWDATTDKPGYEQRLTVDFDKERWDADGSKPDGDLPPRIGDFGKVTRLTKAQGSGMGTLVFTGQPQEWRPGAIPRPGAGHPKHSDFVFANRPVDPARHLAVTHKIFRHFEGAHSGSGEQHATTAEPNDEWGFWRTAYERRDKVPVFFLLTKDSKPTLRAFGLAMMFRLAYDYDTWDALERTQPKRAADKDQLDLAEAIFGRVVDAKAKGAKEGLTLAGRVSLGQASLIGDRKEMGEVRWIPSSPKASYYPTYIAQNTAGNGQLVDRSYKTLMDKDSQLAGWKRYRLQDAVANPPIPASVKSEKVFARFKPLAPGSKFVSQVRVHNLQPHELGALLWALDFGGAEGVFHALGGVKPLGYGRVKLQVRSWQVAPLAEWSADPLADSATGGPRDAVADKAAVIKAYVDWMEEHVTGWHKSEQMRELVACARPLPAGSRDGRYMSVERPNEFQQVKKEYLALRLASGSARRVVALPKEGSAPAAAAAADAWIPATVEQFRDAKVRLKLDSGSVLSVLLDTRVFTEQDWKKPRLNGNDFPAGRRVELILADAKVVRVRPRLAS